MKNKDADFYREVSPPDSLSSMSTGTPSGKSKSPKGEDASSLPNGDSARNIGRPGPDSPNLKTKNLDRSESYGRTPAEGFDGGYVHDSGSGSARVIPYDSGYSNNSSPLRKAKINKESKNVPLDEKLWAEIQALAKGESNKPVSRGKDSVNPVNEGKGFTTFPSAYANGWALAQYKRLGGKWKKESSGKDYKMPRKWDKDHCESKSCDDMGFSEKASCRPYKDCYSKKASSLIPTPPSIENMIQQLPSIIFQYENRYNIEKLQPYLDKCFWEVFDSILTSNGHGSMGREIEKMASSLVPLILALKDHFNLLRPYQLAERIGVPFKSDYLETAQTPTYPSGHTTQAYYIAHILSDKYPQLRSKFFNVAKMVAESRIDRGVHFISDNEAGKILAENLYDCGKSSSRVAYRYLESAKRDDPKMKNTGKGGLGTWFSGHGGGDPDDRATWGDWIAITPIKHTITKPDGKKKTYEPGDIVGPCAISSEPDWKDVTSGGKKPLKCMPREKAWQISKKDRAELAKKKRREEEKHRGQKPVNTPTFNEKAKEITKKKKKASACRVAFLYLQAASQPAQDLGGVKTWVDKTRQDQIKNDTNPQKSRENYEDGKPQRDRVLPLPDGHPKGRDEQRVGPGVVNTPPDSSGQGGANRPKKDPSALSDLPGGKALHERPRSSGVPGDEYGNPYIDQSQTTGMKRRVMGSIEEIEEYDYWDIDGDDLIKIGLFRYNFRPPKGNKRQRSQKGMAKRKSLGYKRKNRVKYRRNLIKQKRLYKRKKHNPTYKRYKKNYAKNPERYKRRPGGGVSTSKQKSQRAEKRRK